MLTCGLLRTNFSFDTAVSLVYVAEPSARIELATPSLPRKCTATVLRGRIGCGWVVLGDLWSGRRDSNPRQPAWKAGALPTELHPQSFHLWCLGARSAVRCGGRLPGVSRGRSGVTRGGRWIRTTVGA